MNHYDLQLNPADDLAKGKGAKFFYDSMLRAKRWDGTSFYFLYTRYYFASKHIDKNKCLQELGHYIQPMETFTEIFRAHWADYADTWEHDRMSTELKELN